MAAIAIIKYAGVEVARSGSPGTLTLQAGTATFDGASSTPNAGSAVISNYNWGGSAFASAPADAATALGTLTPNTKTVTLRVVDDGDNQSAIATLTVTVLPNTRTPRTGRVWRIDRAGG